MEGGSLVTTNPVTPDGSYYWIQYELDSLSAEIPLPGEVETALLIARDSTPPIAVEGLAGIAPEEIGLLATDRVWFGQGLRDQVVRIRAGGADPPVIEWVTFTLALLLLATGIWIIKRGRGGGVPGVRAAGGPTPAAPTSRGPSQRLRRDILVDIARLDEEFKSAAGKARGDPGRYRQRREALLAELEIAPSRAEPWQ
jgi:hypothetical protein